TISVLICSCRSGLRPTKDGRCGIRPSAYRLTSCSLARISNDMFPSNLSVIPGMNLEVAKRFAPHFASTLKISDRNLSRQASDACNSSTASTIMNVLEYTATIDWRALEISSNDARVRLFLYLSCRYQASQSLH